jgi:hypothetical protein
MLDRFQQFSTNHQMMVLMKHCCMAIDHLMGPRKTWTPAELTRTRFVSFTSSWVCLKMGYSQSMIHVYIYVYTYILMGTIMTDPGILRGPIFWATHGHPRPPTSEVDLQQAFVRMGGSRHVRELCSRVYTWRICGAKKKIWSILRGRHGI